MPASAPLEMLQSSVRAFESLQGEQVVPFYDLPCTFIRPDGVWVVQDGATSLVLANHLIDHARSQGYRRTETVGAAERTPRSPASASPTSPAWWTRRGRSSLPSRTRRRRGREMTARRMARGGICALAVLAVASGGGCRTVRETDEAAIRRAFAIPAGARATHYAATPAESGWFGREGLKVEMAFEFDDTDARTYRAAAATDPAWQPLPIPEALLRRMAAIGTARRGLARVYADRHEPLPPDGSVYNPSEQQLLARLAESLPPAPARGRFHVRTAGHDIMHASTTAVLTADRDLPDFMLAMLDEDRGRLVVKVSTRY